jgi:uncharacterized membrane protein YebE (DUF533 family)
MIDATRILDMLVGGGNLAAGQAPVPYEDLRTPPQNPQQLSTGGASDLLERAKGMIGNAAGSLPAGFGGGVAGGVAAGAISSLLLGSKAGREFAGEALKLGAAAALGGLAYRAYANYKSGAAVGNDTTAPAGANPTKLPTGSAANEHALLLVRAMIAAALSDGVLDGSERAFIIGRLGAAGISSEEQRFLAEEIARPWPPAQFVAAAKGPEQRAEIYLASALAIDADTEAERAYLKYLAAALSLDEKLIAHLEAAVQQAKAPAALAATVPQVTAEKGGRSGG